MNKSIIFILLELFTIRYYREYRLSTIKTVRNFFMKRIEKYDDLLKFIVDANRDAVLLSRVEFLCARDFIEYLKTFDKIVKMWYVLYCLT